MMKKMMAIIMVCLLCASLPAAFAGSEDLPEEDPLSLWRLDENIPVSLDLNGDGLLEDVEWRTLETGEWETAVEVSVIWQDGTPVFYDTEALYPVGVYAVDLDGDGAVELLISGDEMSDDYATYCLRCADGGLEPIDIENVYYGMYEWDSEEYYRLGYGMVSAIGENSVTLSGWRDVLGTFWGSRTYSLQDGRMVAADDGLWVFDEWMDPDAWDYRYLTLKQELSVTFTVEDGYSFDKLLPGDELFICASDLQNVVYFITREAQPRSGYFSVSPNTEDGWGLLVGGVPEDEMFEFLPYAG